MDELLYDYYKYLQSTDMSHLSVETYMYDIKNFFEFVQNKKIDLDNLNDKDLKQYKDYLHKKGMEITSINKNIVAVNHFLKSQGIVNVKVKQEKFQRQNFLDDVFTTEDIKKMMDKAEMLKDYRAKAIFATLFYTGTRVSEMLSLKVSDVNKKQIGIIGKGRKYRMIFIPEKLTVIWNEYLPYRVDKGNKLFTGQKGAITRQTVYKIIKNYAKKCDVNLERAYCHSARHLYAKNLVAKNVGLDVVADFLGHSSLQVVQIYTRRSKSELMDIVNEL